jgi:tellurium resistance protein TerD
MSVNLTKGQKVKLEKEGGVKLNNIAIGLGWDVKDGAIAGSDFDLDASIYMLGTDGKVKSNQGLIFYNNLTSPDGSIVHQGDNLTGEGDGDDEVINVDLTKVPADIDKLIVVVNIFDAISKQQNFGMVENSFMRIVNLDGDVEMFKYDLNFDASVATGVQFGTLLRKGDTWAFSADGSEFEGGLAALNTKFGVN